MDNNYQSDTVTEVLKFVEENDIRFVKLTFCDLLGRQKNISILSNRLPAAFTDGVSFDASSINGFGDVANSDLFLVPDPTTLAVLPWRPQQGRVARFYCHITYADKTPFECDTRKILSDTAKKAEEMGYNCKIGTECEFYLFKTDQNGEATDIPFDSGSYLDVAPLDKGENVRREICLSLEDMGLHLESSHHENGPGQNEIDFRFSDILESADNILTFKHTVKSVSARNGLFASFMPKPIEDKSGNGMHVNISLSKNGHNIFKSKETGHSALCESFIAGILEKTKEITLFLNPIINSYDRFGNFEAPLYISWSRGNRSQLIRIPAASGERVRMELRSPDPSANSYIAFALILNAGLYGIENNLSLPESMDKNLYSLTDEEKASLETLPLSLEEAISLAEKSEFARKTLGNAAFDKFIECKKQELIEYNETKDKKEFCKNHYFKLF